MNILFLPSMKKLAVEPSTTVLSAIHNAGLMVPSPCGGHGSCRKCKVQVTKGNSKNYTKEELTALTPEELHLGYRLACCMKIEEDICVILPHDGSKLEESRQTVKAAGTQTEDRSLGLAVDVGTTTVEYILLELKSKTPLLRGHFYNPQRKYGADVIARIGYCTEDKSKVVQLQKELMDALIDHLREGLKNTELSVEDIHKAVVVGNTTMCHIVTGRSPDRLAKAPFTPDFWGGSVEKAAEYKLPFASEATVEVLPIIGGHLGADTTSCLAALQFERMIGCHLLVDIGTNGEIVLKTKNGIFACGTAAGPAFEGASMTYGMCAGTGVINHVLYEEGKVKLQVQGGVRPSGISGTGFIDAVAVLLEAEIVDHTGYLREEYCEMDPLTGQEGYALYKDADGGIYLTRQDIRQLQLAKAAIGAGIASLLEEAGIKKQQLDGVWVAGAFGTHLNLKNAMRIGLLPSVSLGSYHQVGNAALTGAVDRLKDKYTIGSLQAEVAKIQRVELADQEAFKKRFLKEMNF